MASGCYITSCFSPWVKCARTQKQHRARERSVGLFWSQKVYRLYEHYLRNKQAEYLLFCLLFKVCRGFRRFSTRFLSSSGFSAALNIKDMNKSNSHWLKFVAIILILICQFSFWCTIWPLHEHYYSDHVSHKTGKKIFCFYCLFVSWIYKIHFCFNYLSLATHCSVRKSISDANVWSQQPVMAFYSLSSLA